MASKKNRVQKMRSSSGSALLQAVVVTSAVAFMGLAVMQVDTQLVGQARRMREVNEVDGLVDIMRTVISDSDICAQTLMFGSNVQKTNLPFPDLVQMRDADAMGQGMLICLPTVGVAGSKAVDSDLNNDRLIASDADCDIIGSKAPGSSESNWFPKVAIDTVGSSDYRPTSKIFNDPNDIYLNRPPIFVSVRELRFFLTDPVAPEGLLWTDSGSRTVLRGRLAVLVEPLTAGSLSRNWRTVVDDIEIVFDADGDSSRNLRPGIVSCAVRGSAQDLCQRMGCSWDVTQAPSCTCGYSEAKCPDDASGNKQVVMGVDTTGALICQKIESRCALGQVAVGYEKMGIVCEPLGQWFADAWSVCAGGTWSRNVRCVDSTGASLPDESFCSSPKPETQEACP